MAEEYRNNPQTVISGGNIIGDELGYLENISTIQGVNCEITPSSLIINEDNFNAVNMSPVIGQLMILYAETFRDYINTTFDGQIIKLSATTLNGSAMSRPIVIFDRQEKITDNLLAVEVSNPLTLPNNVLYSDSSIIIQNKKYLVDAESTLYFYGEYTANQNYLKLNPEEKYTFSFYSKNSNKTVKLIVKFYDEYYNIIDSVESDDLIAFTESRLYLTMNTPIDTKYAAFEIKTNSGMEIYNLMLNEGNLKPFVSGYESEIKNSNFLEHNEIRFSHTAETPFGTNIRYDVYNNGEIYESNLLSPFILETAELGTIEIKAKLSTDNSTNIVSLTNLIITGV